jgi:vacuolar protein 8
VQGPAAGALQALVERVRAGEVYTAREVRRLTRTSAKQRRKLASAVEPFIAMLRSGAPDSREAALLNLAVRGVLLYSDLVGREGVPHTFS